MPRLRKRNISKPLKKKKVIKYTTWRNKLDSEFSKLIRSKMRCERCGFTGGRLECSHVVSRRNKTTRWDILNALCLCSRCHIWWWHEEPLESSAWFKQTYPDRYAYLMEAKLLVVNRTDEDYQAILEAIRNKDFDKLIQHQILDKSNKV